MILLRDVTALPITKMSYLISKSGISVMFKDCRVSLSETYGYMPPYWLLYVLVLGLRKDVEVLIDVVYVKFHLRFQGLNLFLLPGHLRV